MGAREYNPGTGTFTSRDPVGDPRVRNGYSYTSANPLGGIDPTGMDMGDPKCQAAAQNVQDSASSSNNDAGEVGGSSSAGGHTITVIVGWIQCIDWGAVRDGVWDKGRDAVCYFASCSGGSPPSCEDSANEIAYALGCGPFHQDPCPNGGDPGRECTHHPGTHIGHGGSGSRSACLMLARWLHLDAWKACGPKSSLALPSLLGLLRPRPLSNYERYGGRPATVLPPIPHSDLFNQVAGGGTAVPNYPGRYQIDPTTGQLIDTGAAGLAHDPAAVTTVVIPDYPGSPQFIISNLAEDPDEPPDIPDPETDGDCGDESDDTTEGHDTAHGGNPSECSDSGSDDELQLEQLHLALGLTSIRTPGQPRKPNSLAAFAAEHNAKTWKQPPFNQFWRYPTPSSHQEMIDYTVMQAGRISFNLDGMLELDKVVTGQRQVGLTEKELYYICTTPAARQITTFYNGENPC
jgi:hypothetical protein